MGTGFPARKAEAKRGKLRGIGIANYIELTMGFPREWSEVVVHADGHVDVAVGTLSSGQGHETSFTAYAYLNGWACAFDKVKLASRAIPTACRWAVARIRAAPCAWRAW